MKKDGSQDLSIVESVFDELDGKFNHSLIVLKVQFFQIFYISHLINSQILFIIQNS